MVLNKNILTNILQSNFELEITECIEDAIMNMESRELEKIFEEFIDYAYLDEITGMEVSSFSVEEEDNVITVFGDLHVRAFIEGYVHWDGEEEFVGVNEAEILLEYSFEIAGEKYYNLELAFV